MSNISTIEEEHNFKSLIKYGKQKILGKKEQLKNDNNKNTENINNTEDVLNNILPPKESINPQGQIIMEYVETNPATKLNVLELQNELDKQLQIRKARETGICPIREELYSQCFDELIRQITINCSHRGLLLVRVRDEIRMNIQKYQRLYESALGYGIRVSLDGEQKKKNLDDKIFELKNESDVLKNEVDNLKQELEDLHNLELENEKNEEENHKENLDNILDENKKAREILEKILFVK